MRLYWSVILTCWTTGWVTFAATKVGEMTKPSEISIILPWTMFLLIAFPAIVGFLIGKESK